VISILAMLDEIYLKLSSATIMQRIVANNPIGVQMYTITGSSDHYTLLYIVQLTENSFI